MAYPLAEEFPGHSTAGLRSLDNLEASVLHQSKRVTGAHRVRNDGAIRTRRSHHDLVAWIIVGISAPTGAAAIATVLVVISRRY